MPVKLPSNPGVIEDRLAALEDPVLAERLFLEHPTLYGDDPPQTERAVLAWTTRRFGTVALAVTAALSVAAGYFLTPLVTHRSEPARPSTQPKTAPAPSRPAAHRHIVKKAAPAHVAHRSALVPAAPVHPRVAPPHPIVHHVTVVHPPVILRHPNREAIALRAKLHAQEAEIATLRRKAALEEAAARAAQARASAAIAAARQGSATRTAPAPLPQPRTQPAADVYAPAGSADPSVSNATGPVDAPAPTAGTRPPPSAPNGGWTERPPILIYGSGPGPVPVGPMDPCTPQGGRLGIVIHSLLGGHSGIGTLHIRL